LDAFSSSCFYNLRGMRFSVVLRKQLKKLPYVVQTLADRLVICNSLDWDSYLGGATKESREHNITLLEYGSIEVV
jgi:hypothetical protein